MLPENQLTALQEFCDRSVFQAGTKPLKNGTEIAIYVDGKGPLNLIKREGRAVLLVEAPKKADLSLYMAPGALAALSALSTEDVGEVGVEILKLMAESDPDRKVEVKVHIGIIDFVFHGYLGILPLGGATVMKFLASKGFNSISKIREAIANLRSER